MSKIIDISTTGIQAFLSKFREPGSASNPEAFAELMQTACIASMALVTTDFNAEAFMKAMEAAGIPRVVTRGYVTGEVYPADHVAERVRDAMYRHISAVHVAHAVETAQRAADTRAIFLELHANDGLPDRNFSDA